MTAVQGGRSVDTTMGFTPLEGLVMGTRCGGIDPAAVLFVLEQHGIGLAAMIDLLNSRAACWRCPGWQQRHARRDAAAEPGNAQAAVALDIFCYRIRKYIGAYAAVMGGLDAVVFTGGIGENSPQVRERVCVGMGEAGGFGSAGRSANGRLGVMRSIHVDGSRVKALSSERPGA